MKPLAGSDPPKVKAGKEIVKDRKEKFAAMFSNKKDQQSPVEQAKDNKKMGQISLFDL